MSFLNLQYFANFLPYRMTHHMGRKLDVEPLDPEEIVYKDEDRSGYMITRSNGIPAKNAITSCCDAVPLKYYPDSPRTERWWLICSNCKHAISKNGAL